MKFAKHAVNALMLIGLATATPDHAYSQQTTVDVVYPAVSTNQKVLSLIGTVDAKQNAQLAPLQSGVVEQLFVEEGDTVELGQKLMKLDAKLAELSLAQAQGALKAAKANHEEAKRLYLEVTDLSKRQLVAETLLAERKSSVAVTEADLNQAQANLDQQKEVVARHTLYAPFSGVISVRHIDLGEWVTQQTTTFTLVEQSKLRLRISIPQEYARQLSNHHNIRVVVSPDYDNSTSIEATLDRLVRVAAGTSRTLSGLVSLPSDSLWVAGMSARADIYLPAGGEQLVWLPKSAIKQHPDGGRSVFAVVGQKAKRYIVNEVRQSGQRVAVSGAPLNYPIVSSGVELLKEGVSLQLGNVEDNRS